MTWKGKNFIILSYNYLHDHIYSSECAQLLLLTARIESFYEEHCCIFSLGYISSQECSLCYFVAIWLLLITTFYLAHLWLWEKLHTFMGFICLQMEHSGWYNMTSILYHHVCMHNERHVLQGMFPIIGRRNNFIKILYTFLHIDMLIWFFTIITFIFHHWIYILEVFMGSFYPYNHH